MMYRKQLRYFIEGYKGDFLFIAFFFLIANSLVALLLFGKEVFRSLFGSYTSFLPEKVVISKNPLPIKSQEGVLKGKVWFTENGELFTNGERIFKGKISVFGMEFPKDIYLDITDSKGNRKHCKITSIEGEGTLWEIGLNCQLEEGKVTFSYKGEKATCTAFENTITCETCDMDNPKDVENVYNVLLKIGSPFMLRLPTSYLSNYQQTEVAECETKEASKYSEKWGKKLNDYFSLLYGNNQALLSKFLFSFISDYDIIGSEVSFDKDGDRSVFVVNQLIIDVDFTKEKSKIFKNLFLTSFKTFENLFGNKGNYVYFFYDSSKNVHSGQGIVETIKKKDICGNYTYLKKNVEYFMVFTVILIGIVWFLIIKAKLEKFFLTFEKEFKLLSYLGSKKIFPFSTVVAAISFVTSFLVVEVFLPYTEKSMNSILVEYLIPKVYPEGIVIKIIIINIVTILYSFLLENRKLGRIE
ncbi:MAG: hypothetical protein ABGX27_07110 [Desulfurobacteriaceae bacterium]